MMRYDGYYSNVKRGKRKKDEQDDSMPFVMEEAGVSPEKRKAWARLIQKIYEVDPLTSPQCQGTMTPLLGMVSNEIDEMHSTRLNPCRGMPS